MIAALRGLATVILVGVLSAIEVASAAVSANNPQLATIQGYSGPQEDPVISPDGKYLFFDIHTDSGATASLYYAQVIDYRTFKFIGEVKGVNFPGAMTLRGNYDLSNNFYFVSTKFRTACGMIAHGVFKNGTITNVAALKGLCAPPAPPGQINVTFDVAITPDGNTLYYDEVTVDATGAHGPQSSKIAVAKKNPDGSFTKVANSAAIFQTVNAVGALVYNAAPMPDGLTMYYTASLPDLGPVTFFATRALISQPFQAAQQTHDTDISGGGAQPGFGSSEIGGVSPDGKYIYFHRLLSPTTSQVYVLTH
jgi:hypothetical protein